MGAAGNALYFREPIRAACADRSDLDWQAGEYVDPDRPAEALTAITDAVFSGRPPNVRGVFAFRDTPRDLSTPARLLIKEIHLGATEFFIRRYRPKIVLLYRHPAAVALSIKNIGWHKKDRNISRSNSSGNVSTSDDFWQAQGERQALIHRRVFDITAEYGDCRKVKYEDLCENSFDQFRDLAEYLGLNYSPGIENQIRKSDRTPPNDDPYSTMRPTRQMPNAWKEKLAVADLETLRDAYLANDPPVYETLADWL